MSLENLNISEIGDAVQSYRNLLHHRTVYLEGVRSVAFRNVLHLFDAQDAVDLTMDEYEWIAAIQSKMLQDQGLHDNAINRYIVSLATFGPLQAYLALFYAEIEYIRKLRRKSRFFIEAEFSNYLDENEETIDKLKQLRDAFLHPSKKSLQSEMEFLYQDSSLSDIPERQNLLDGYLQSTRSKLNEGLILMLSELPESQKLYCLKLGLLKNLDRMTTHKDPTGIEHVKGQIAGLDARAAQITSFTPSAQQKRFANKLSDYLNEVSPSGPEQTRKILPGNQTPINFEFVAPFFSGESKVEGRRESKSTKHTIENIGFIQRMLVTAGALINESVTWLGEYSLEEAALIEPRALLNKLDMLGLQDSNIVAAPIRTATALLYEPLRLYARIERDDPSVREDVLSEFVTRSEKLRQFRHSVFHVLDRSNTHPTKRDLVDLRL